MHVFSASYPSLGFAGRRWREPEEEEQGVEVGDDRWDPHVSEREANQQG